MPGVSDQTYLLQEQYRTAANLDARIALHARFSTNTYGWFPWLFERLRLPARCRILELGCGTGRLWSENAARIPAEWRITLTDFSPGMVDEARRALHEGPHAFEFAVVDAQAIPYADDSYDAVLANHMLFHVPDRARALGEMRRVLRPGGYLYASTIGRSHLRELEDLAAGQPSDFSGEYGFTLENGAAQLAPYFAAVTLHRYDDALVVTEAQPLIAAILSMRLAADFDSRARADLTRRVEHAIATHGAIHITKDGGLFEALYVSS